jgi:hypothetical protein
LPNRRGDVVGESHDRHRLDGFGLLEVRGVGEKFAKLGEIISRDRC